VGLRRWVIFLSLVALPLVGFTGAANAMEGPYNVTCSNGSNGFTVIITSWKTGQSSYIPIPVWNCPG
jgi:hypothetical protein